MKLEVALRRREARDDPHIQQALGDTLVVSRGPFPPFQPKRASSRGPPFPSISSLGSRRPGRHQASLSTFLTPTSASSLFCSASGSVLGLQASSLPNTCWLTPATPQEWSICSVLVLLAMLPVRQTWSVLSILNSQDLAIQQTFGENLVGGRASRKASYPDSRPGALLSRRHTKKPAGLYQSLANCKMQGWTLQSNPSTRRTLRKGTTEALWV